VVIVVVVVIVLIQQFVSMLLRVIPRVGVVIITVVVVIVVIICVVIIVIITDIDMQTIRSMKIAILDTPPTPTIATVFMTRHALPQAFRVTIVGCIAADIGGTIVVVVDRRM
jgi:hypothetical protein